MRARHVVVLGLLLASGAGLGCHGPSSTCEGTMSSFASIIDSNSWDDLPGIISPKERAKYGDTMIAKWASSNYFGCKKFKFTKVEANVSGNVCLARSLASWHEKIRGKRPVDYNDEYYTYTMHLINGKWYMDLPGASKIQGY